MNDYVRAVAQAYASQDPQLRRIADQALKGILEEQERLNAQAFTIRQLVSLVFTGTSQPRETEAARNQATKAHNPSSPGFLEILQKAVAAAADASSVKLSDQVKNRIREIWVAEFRRSGRDLSAMEMAALLKAEGLALPVAQPAPSIGTVLGPLRRQYRPDGTDPTSQRGAPKG
jgi:hypothetical protein